MIERETSGRAPKELSPASSLQEFSDSTSQANLATLNNLQSYKNSIEIPALNLAGLNVFSAAQALSSTSPIEYPELSAIRPIFLPSNPPIDPSKP